MKYRLTPIAFALCSALPFAAQAAPKVAFTSPGDGATLSGTVNGGTCEVKGTSDIRRVVFRLNNTEIGTDTGSPWNCGFDSTKWPDGAHTLKATAYDRRGDATMTKISVTIANSASQPAPTPPPSEPAPAPSDPVSGPTVQFTAPAEGGPLKGNVQGPPNCIVEGSNIARVMFYLNDVWINTDGNLSNGLGCWLDTTQYKDGPYTVKAVAYDAAGKTATATRSIVIANSTTSTPPPPAAEGPTVQFTAPAEGGPLKGNVQGPPNCIVTGSNITRVMFYLNDQWTNTDGNLDNGLGCWIDTTKYADGPYTVKAVAYDAEGRTATATRSIVIANNTASGNTPPTVAFKTPVVGATLKGLVNSTTCEAAAADTDGKVSKVDFFVGTTLVNTKTASPWQCAIDTTKFSDGDHTLMAVATDDGGAKATTQRAVKIDNSVSTDPGDGGGSSPISSADIIGWAHQDAPFSSQDGYTAQVIGTFTSAPSIPESGIHGSVLSNGESLRLGKATDPTSSARKALAFQVSPSDPTTSGSKRSELKFSNNVELNKTYWIALSVFIEDWGSLKSTDKALFGTQMHSGDNSRGLSPSFGIYTAGSNGRSLQVQTRYSTSSSPSQGNTTTIRHAEHPIPFGRWVDFVVKFRHSTSSGFLQAWMDGTQIANYQGPLGFNTPGYKDYAKFGYYNWSSFNSPRKVMLRSPVIVADPTGSKYGAADLRAHLKAGSQ